VERQKKEFLEKDKKKTLIPVSSGPRQQVFSSGEIAKNEIKGDPSFRAGA